MSYSSATTTNNKGIMKRRTLSESLASADQPQDTTSNDSMSSSCCSAVVIFDCIEIREHQVILDQANPLDPKVAPLTIGWEAVSCSRIAIDEDEMDMDTDLSREARRLTSRERISVLMNAGFLLSDIYNLRNNNKSWKTASTGKKTSFSVAA